MRRWNEKFGIWYEMSKIPGLGSACFHEHS